MAQTVKNLLAMREIWVQSLSWEHLLEKGMTTHSSILAWGIPWTEEPGGLQSMQWQRVRHDGESNTFHFHFSPRISSLRVVVFMKQHLIIWLSLSLERGNCLCVCVNVSVHVCIVLSSGVLPNGESFHHHYLSQPHLSGATLHSQSTVRSFGKTGLSFSLH